MAVSTTCRSSTALLVPLLSKRQTATLTIYFVLVCFFLAKNYRWWLNAEKPPTSKLTLLMGVLIDSYYYAVLCVLMPLLYFRAMRLNPCLPPPKGLRVAMIVTKVPSEPLDMVTVTLSGMLKQDYPYPYDVWLADEAPDDATRGWCKAHGVHISCRQGVPEYHRDEWPRRTKCKEGNLAYFYDHWGYQQYDVVCQFDADHVPRPDYLRRMLPAFSDPRVGYAAMPSINDSHIAGSWCARGRCYLEGHQHGLWGCASNYDWLPFAIGSHYAVRTQALKEAGGIGPELDEDVSTSYIITAAGYKGVFCIDAIASGEGPSTFADAAHQEYQWARSAMVLLVRHTAPYWPGLTWRQRLKLMWAYGFWIYITLCVGTGLVWLVDVAFAPSSAAAHRILAFGMEAQYHTLPIKLLLCLLQLWIISNGWSRPLDVPALSWEAMLFRVVAAWWVAKGTVHGLLGATFGMRFDIKVTPKSKDGGTPMPLSCLMPFLAVAGYALAVALLTNGHLLMAGVAISSLTVSWLLLMLHLKENFSIDKPPALSWLQPLLLPLLGLTGLTYHHICSGCYSGRDIRRILFTCLMIPFKEVVYPFLSLVPAVSDDTHAAQTVRVGALAGTDTQNPLSSWVAAAWSHMWPPNTSTRVAAAAAVPSCLMKYVLLLEGIDAMRMVMCIVAAAMLAIGVVMWCRPRFGKAAAAVIFMHGLVAAAVAVQNQDGM